MEDRILNHFDGTRNMLKEIDTEFLFEYSGDFFACDLEYGVYKDERGFVLILVDLEDSYSWIDDIFETKDELESRVNTLKKTLKNISSLDNNLHMSRKYKSFRLW